MSRWELVAHRRCPPVTRRGLALDHWRSMIDSRQRRVIRAESRRLSSICWQPLGPVAAAGQSQRDREFVLQTRSSTTGPSVSPPSTLGKPAQLPPVTSQPPSSRQPPCGQLVRGTRGRAGVRATDPSSWTHAPGLGVVHRRGKRGQVGKERVKNPPPLSERK